MEFVFVMVDLMREAQGLEVTESDISEIEKLVQALSDRGAMQPIIRDAIWSWAMAIMIRHRG